MARRHQPLQGVGEEPDARFERTDLAWNRSGLALLACLAIVARRSFPLDSRRRATETDRHGAGAAARLRVVTASTVVLAIAAFALGLFPPEE